MAAVGADPARVGGRKLRDWARALQLAGALLAGSGAAQAAVECAAADATGARFCTAGVRGDIVRAMEATQERDNWCWAAVISMVLRRHGIAAPQHDIVTRSLGAPLDQGLRTREIPDVFEREWRARDNVAPGRAIAVAERVHLSDARVADTLLATLAADQPVIMSARGHAVVLVALIYMEQRAGGHRKVLGGLVIDPLPMQGLRYVREDEMQPTLLARVEVREAGGMPKAPVRQP